ncbi:hypothetical protein [Asanoa siamensis]|uniref:Uncharacterized protein n=1 Tax=Asanoa siamensis TaxID=926357 RepID=A0ABQ4CUZ2_9ACTN|nr:hypothetical protein [Asanoa siamensis]GIF75099.1 hypothetical protein Asi02nite_46170 [Asanoa siamensis]
METNGPGPSRYEAANDLAAIAHVQRAVRNRPWPIWLYPANALLLGGLALTGLIESSALAALVALALACSLAAVNYRVGRAIGTPYAIPSSRGFRVLAALSAAFVIVSVLVPADGPRWLILAGAAGAVISYTAGAAVHVRSTRR